MEIQSLPRYRGLPDSRNGWWEPDGHGKKPSMRLRDYVVLALIIIIGLPIFCSLVLHLWTCRRDAESMNSARERQMEEENKRTLFFLNDQPEGQPVGECRLSDPSGRNCLQTNPCGGPGPSWHGMSS
jgi:hypothetical protein